MKQLYFQILLLFNLFYNLLIFAHYCGFNQIPCGIKVHKNNQPVLLCSKPSCFEKIYAECDEIANKFSCESNTSWVGGINKSVGRFMPLYVRCCEFEELPNVSQLLYENVIIKAGEYYEGEEITNNNNEVIAFDLITNIKMIPNTNATSPGDYEYEDPKSEDDVVNITYIQRDGTEKNVRGKIGDNVMYLAHRHNVEIEGACEASLACCTCHVYVEDSFYDKLPQPTEEEEDMLDMAPVLKANSRLSCQIILNKKIDCIRVALPKITRNFYVDGHVPESH